MTQGRGDRIERERERERESGREKGVTREKEGLRIESDGAGVQDIKARPKGRN
jgi:hypothetical protein